MSTQDEFERLVEYIHSAIESEQPEPADFKAETELRLRLVYAALRRALGMSENVGNGNHSAVQIE
jgi:hypothetical protein